MWPTYCVELLFMWWLNFEKFIQISFQLLKCSWPLMMILCILSRLLKYVFILVQIYIASILSAVYGIVQMLVLISIIIQASHHLIIFIILFYYMHFTKSQVLLWKVLYQNMRIIYVNMHRKLIVTSWTQWWLFCTWGALMGIY